MKQQLNLVKSQFGILDNERKFDPATLIDCL